MKCHKYVAVAAKVGETAHGFTVSLDNLNQMVSQFKEIPVLWEFDTYKPLGTCVRAEVVGGELEASLTLTPEGLKHLDAFAAVGFTAPSYRTTESHAQENVTQISR